MSVTIEAVYERGLFRPLQPVALPEGQRVSVTVPAGAMSLAEAQAHLAKWHRVYEGLSDEEVAEVESIALDRANFSRMPT
ncbi:MAG: antitoxin family protein [Armatimonadetes bacterium]|nr:antitoxin family protein [Armatimonadota bacterium]